MTNILRSMCMRALTSTLAGVAVLGLAGCKMDVVNPSVIDASTFNPNADGRTLALSAQTNFFTAFQNAVRYGGLISEEMWTGQNQTAAKRYSARAFFGTDFVNSYLFAPLSLAVASNVNAVLALEDGPGAASDPNLARASMNLGFSLELMAETMCAGVIQGGPQLSDVQLLDSAIVRFTNAIAIGTAAGGTDGTDIVNASNVGLARAYLQKGDYTNAAQTAALVPTSFVANAITSANVSTQSTLGNQMYQYTLLRSYVVPKLYRVNDLRMTMDSTVPGSTENGIAFVAQTKYTSYGDQIRLASGLEAQYIQAEATLHGTGVTGPAVTLITVRRSAGGQSAYAGGTDSTSVMRELLNQAARDFWLEGKKLGDLRRNPSVPFSAVLMDATGAPFYVTSPTEFGSTICAPIPPEETNANPNATP